MLFQRFRQHSLQDGLDVPRWLPKWSQVGYSGRLFASIAPSLRQLSLKLGSWPPSWTSLASFWLPFGHDFGGKVLPRRPRCRQNPQKHPPGTDFLWFGDPRFINFCVSHDYITMTVTLNIHAVNIDHKYYLFSLCIVISSFWINLIHKVHSLITFAL